MKKMYNSINILGVPFINILKANWDPLDDFMTAKGAPKWQVNCTPYGCHCPKGISELELVLESNYREYKILM